MLALRNVLHQHRLVEGDRLVQSEGNDIGVPVPPDLQRAAFGQVAAVGGAQVPAELLEAGGVLIA